MQSTPLRCPRSHLNGHKVASQHGINLHIEMVRTIRKMSKMRKMHMKRLECFYFTIAIAISTTTPYRRAMPSTKGSFGPVPYPLNEHSTIISIDEKQCSKRKHVTET